MFLGLQPVTTAALGKAIMTRLRGPGVALVVFSPSSGPVAPPSNAGCTESALVVVIRLHQPLISGITTEGFQLGQSAALSPFHHFNQFHVKSMKVVKW